MSKKLIATLESVKDFPALVNAGVDEILVAIEGYSFSALKSITLEQLDSLDGFAQTMHKDVSLIVNRFFHETDLENLHVLKKYVDTHNIHALYFGDLAIAKTFQDSQVKKIYMPDTLVTSQNDVNFWISMNIGTVISPLLTIEETLEIANQSEGSIAIVHGRTNLSRSYRPLLSAWKQEYNSSVDVENNYDLYVVEEKRDGKMPIYEDENGTLIYSDYVLDSFDEMEDLLKTNLSGIMVNGLYQDRNTYLNAIHAYRRILDGENAQVVRKEYEEMTGTSISSGYYHEKTVR